MSTAVILGAGDIGGALARQLAAIDLVSRIVIVDELANIAAGKALDVAQSAPVDRYHTTMAGTADVAAVVGAAVVIVADTAQAVSEWKDEAGLALIKRAAGLNQRAPLICAGTSQASVIERGVNEAGISRMRLFGAAPEALRSAIIAIVALEAGAAPADISLSVLGRAPQQIIVPCGIADKGVTSLTAKLGKAPSMTEVEDRFIEHFAAVFDRSLTHRATYA